MAPALPAYPALPNTAKDRIRVESEYAKMRDAHEAVRLTGRSDLRFEMQEPKGVKDWNDELRANPKPFVPCCPREARPA